MIILLYIGVTFLLWLPVSLDELLGRELLAVPLDPFTHKPLVFRCEGGRYRLYSLGARRVDLGGRAGNALDVGFGRANLSLEMWNKAGGRSPRV